MISFLRWVKDMKWLLSHEGLWMASEYARKCSVSHTARKRVNRNQKEASAYTHWDVCYWWEEREQPRAKRGSGRKWTHLCIMEVQRGSSGTRCSWYTSRWRKNEQIQQTSVLPVHGGTNHSSPDRGPSCLWLVDESTFRKEPCCVTSTGPWRRQAL